MHAAPTGAATKMPTSRTPRPISQRMAAVHALGHPNSPLPQTRWPQPTHSQAGEPLVPATITTPSPAPHAPNTPGAASLAQGAGSNLSVTWTAPAVDSTHSAATGFNLRSSPSGAGTWTTVTGVTSPYGLSGLAAGAATDVELQSSNAAGASAWSAISTLITTADGAPNTPSAVLLAQGVGSNLTVTWTAPAVDSTHGAATGFNLRSSPSGAGTWTIVTGAASPYSLMWTAPDVASAICSARARPVAPR